MSGKKYQYPIDIYYKDPIQYGDAISLPEYVATNRVLSLSVGTYYNIP